MKSDDRVLKSTWPADLTLVVPMVAFGVSGITWFQDVAWGVGFLVASPVVLLGRRRSETRIGRDGITVRGPLREKAYPWVDIRGAEAQRSSATSFRVVLVTAAGRRVPVEPQRFGLLRAPEQIKQLVDHINRRAQAEAPQRRLTTRDPVDLPLTLRMAGPTRLLAALFIAVVGVAALASAVRAPFVGLFAVPLASAVSAILYFRILGRYVRLDRTGITVRLWRRQQAWAWRDVDGLLIQRGRFLGQRVSLLIPHGSIDLSELTLPGARSLKAQMAAWERLAATVDARRP